MNLLKKVFPGLLILLLINTAYAQDTDVAGLIKQGIQLSSKRDHAGAIEKYQQALITEPDNAQANYQLAYSLNALGRGTEGIACLNKVVKAVTSLTGPAYELLGSIYDGSHQPQQAIDAYQQGIKLKPGYQPLYFNLGIAYFRAQKYAEAELAAIEAIKLDPKHANSQRLYGLVTFHQNKRAAALMGLCNYLLLDPEGPRADEAYTNLQSILKGGTLKTDRTDAANIALNKALNAAVAAADKKQGVMPGNVLDNQLKTIFVAIGQLEEKQGAKDFFANYYASFFYRLSQTPYMDAFVKLISLSGNKATNSQWLKDNADKREEFYMWVAEAERKF